MSSIVHKFFAFECPGLVGFHIGASFFNLSGFRLRERWLRQNFITLAAVLSCRSLGSRTSLKRWDALPVRCRIWSGGPCPFPPGMVGSPQRWRRFSRWRPSRETELHPACRFFCSAIGSLKCASCCFPDPCELDSAGRSASLWCG